MLILPHFSKMKYFGLTRKPGSSVVSALGSGARGPRFDFRSRRGKFGERTCFL